MPASSRRSGTFSPPLSSATGTTTQRTKLNVVSRLAIRGKAEPSDDNAAIKLFLRLSLPMDSVSPGMTVPLFPEENIKIREFKAHALDAKYAPYAFSPSAHPLLSSAARALNLPKRLNKSYESLFSSGQAPVASNRRESSTSRAYNTNGSTVPQQEERYMGYILVSGYNVCYVVPKELPTRAKPSQEEDDIDIETMSRSNSRSSYVGRKYSHSDKGFYNFMVAIAISVPYLSKPPKAPYLLSIPIPKCLSNTINISIPPITSTAASFASLSSEEEPVGWDLSSEPNVTGLPAKHVSRMHRHTEFSDEQSSDSSIVGVSDGYGIHGSFTSTDCIRIRWASRSSLPSMTDRNGRRRVEVREVQGDLTYTILRQDAQGIRMRLNYSGSCKGLWFPGVATMLALDVILESHGLTIVWPPGQDQSWNIDGGKGFTGFDVGSSKDSENVSRQSSFSYSDAMLSHDNSPDMNRQPDDGMEGHKGSISSASLLRVALPQQNIEEYSFENSPTPASSAIPSTVSSLTGSSSFHRPLLPSTPIRIHLNMDDLAPPPKNTFNFNISGTIIVNSSQAIPRPTSQEISGERVHLPVFRVTAAENQFVTQTVRNQTEESNIEVASVLHNKISSSSAQRTILKRGSQTKCNNDQTVIALHSTQRQVKSEIGITDSPRGSIESPNATPILLPPLRVPRSLENYGVPELYRDGPLVIPWVTIEVLARSNVQFVVIRLPAPVDDGEWFEFALAMPNNVAIPDQQPDLEIASVSIADIPVRFETYDESTRGVMKAASAGYSEKMLTTTYLAWLRVHTLRSGILEVSYVIRSSSPQINVTSKQRVKDSSSPASTSCILPTFALPIGRFDIAVAKDADHYVNINSNMIVRQDRPDEQVLTVFAVEPFFIPEVLVVEASTPQWRQNNARTVHANASNIWSSLPIIVALVSLAFMMQLNWKMQELRSILQNANGGAGAEQGQTTTLIPTIIATSDRRRLTETQAMPTVTTASETEFTWESRRYTQTASPSAMTPNINNALLPLHYVPLTWSLAFEWDYDEVKEAVVTRLEKIWDTFRILFHWPLPPE